MVSALVKVTVQKHPKGHLPDANHLSVSYISCREHCKPSLQHFFPWSYITVHVFVCLWVCRSIRHWTSDKQLQDYFISSTCAIGYVSRATRKGSPGWLQLLMLCVYFSQTGPKDTPGWYGERRGKEAEGELVWSDGWSQWFKGCWYRADSPGSATDSL